MRLLRALQFSILLAAVVVAILVHAGRETDMHLPEWQVRPRLVPDVDGLPKGAIARLGRQNGLIGVIAVSPDDRFLATVHVDQGRASCAVRLWNVKTGEYLLTLGGRHEQILAAAFSPDGNILAFGGVDNVLRLWDTGTGKQIGEYPHKQVVHAVIFTSDGKKLLIGSDSLQLRDVASGQVLRTFALAEALRVPFRLALSPDDRVLVLGNDYQDLRLMEVATGQERTRLPVRLAFASSGAVLAFSPDGTSLLATDKGELAIFSRLDGKLVRKFVGPGTHSHMEVSPDGKHYACEGASDGSLPRGTIQIRDLTTGVSQATIKRSESRPFCFSADGKQLFVGGTSLDAYSVPDGTLIRTLVEPPASIVALRLSDQNREIHALTELPDWRTWDIEGRRELRRHKVPLPDGEAPLSVSANGKVLATIDAKRVLRVRDAAAGRLLKDCGVINPLLYTCDMVALAPNGGRVVWLAFGKTSGQMGLVAWDLVGDKELWQHPPPTGTTSVVFSKSGRHLYTTEATWPVTVLCRLADSGKTVDTLQLNGQDNQVTLRVVPSPDERLLAVIAEKTINRSTQPQAIYYVDLWDFKGKRKLHGGYFAGCGHCPSQPGRDMKPVYVPLNAYCPPVTFSADGLWLASGRRDISHTILLCDVKTGQLRESPAGHSSGITSLAFVGEGKHQTLISASHDGTMLLWDATKWEAGNARRPPFTD